MARVICDSELSQEVPPRNWFGRLAKRLARSIDKYLAPPEGCIADIGLHPLCFRYKGNKGYCQVAYVLKASYVSAMVKEGEGHIVHRVMEVTEREYYHDFDTACTSFNFRKTIYQLRP